MDDLLPSTIQEMIGDQVMIKTVDGEERGYNVVSWICLGKEVPPSEIVVGSVVYYYSSEPINSSAWVNN
ncbi:hypothetical protein [Paenibacillus sp. AN1007]|uniref:Uncharacterized protein n=1 Tax=Paenibacillus sp. AN1007 TaxID=3151385 RepID=A0AAU8N8C0_9BACL